MESGLQERDLNVANFGSFPSVNPLLKQTKDPNLHDSEESALGVACSQGEFDSVKLLIEQGVDINKKDPANLCPIVRAATNGHKVIVEYLISNGAKIGYDLLRTVKTKIEIMEEGVANGYEDPYEVATWKNFLDYLIEEGKKQ